MADTDVVEWILLDTDLVTRLAILPVISSHLYLELSEPGSGSLEIPLDTTAAGRVANGQFCQLWYRGAARGGFFVDNIKITDASAGEGAGRVLSVSGRGPLALLDEAIIWQDGSGTTERSYTAQSKAAILIDQIAEAQARGALDALTYDFTGTSDSTGTSWTDSEDLSFPVGTTLLDLCRQFYTAGEMEFDVTLSTSDVVLSAYKNGVGTNKTTTVYFRLGSNCIEAGSDERGDEIRNAMLVKYKDGYSFVSSTDSIATRRRREKLISLEVAQSSASANTYASAKLTDEKDPHKSISVQVYDGVPPYLFTDYTLGDTVTLDKLGTEVTFRILGIQIDCNGPDMASVILEMNWVQRNDNDLDWLMKQWVTAHDADLSEVRQWMGFGQPNAPVHALEISGNTLYVGGEFTAITNKIFANYIARYDVVTGTWTPMGAGATDTVVAIKDFNGVIFAATADYVKRWSAVFETWTTVLDFSSALDGTITCMEVSDDLLWMYVGATIAGAASDIVMAYDGGTWTVIKTGVIGGDEWSCHALAFYNGNLHAGFLIPSTSPQTNILQVWDGAAWSEPLSSPVVSSTSTSISAMEAVGDLLFYKDDNAYIYAWNGTDTDTADIVGVTSGIGGTLNTAIAANLSDAIVGGNAMNGDTDIINIGAYTGGLWARLSTGLNDFCRTIVTNDTNVYAGGDFTTAGGKALPYLAVWITSFENLIDQVTASGQFDLGAAIHSASTSAITNNDEIPFWEDTAQALRKMTWADTKSAMQTYTDTLYVALTGNQSVDGVKTFTDAMQVINPDLNDAGIYIETLGNAFTLDVEQYSATDGSITSPVLFLYRQLTGTATANSPVIEIWKSSTAAGGSSDTGDMLYYQVDGSEKMRVTHAGAQYWTGEATGLPYGSFYGGNIAWAQATAAQNTWYEISDTDIAAGQLHLVTHDGQGKLTLSKAGRYLVNYSVSLECSAATHELQAAISVSGTENANGLSSVDITSANDMVTIGGTAILDLAANATIEVSVRTRTAGTPTLTVNHLSASVLHIGGT